MIDVPLRADYPGPMANPAAHSRFRILIVDDSAEMRSEIRAFVHNKNIDWFEASDGDEVGAKYEQVRPNLVLMDIRMQRIDGITATRELLKVHPEAKVIAITQYADPVYRVAAHDVGAVDYLGKDDLEALKSTVFEYAGLTRLSGTGRRSTSPRS